MDISMILQLLQSMQGGAATRSSLGPSTLTSAPNGGQGISPGPSQQSLPGELPQGNTGPTIAPPTAQESAAAANAARRARGQAMANALATAQPPTTRNIGSALQPSTPFNLDSLTTSMTQWPQEWQFILQLLQSIASRQPITPR